MGYLCRPCVGPGLCNCWGRHRRRPLIRIESCRVWLVGRRMQEGRQPTELGHPHISSGALSLLSLLVMGAAYALAFLAASLRLLPRVSRHIAQIGPSISPRHKYKPPTGPRTGDDPMWSNGWAATSANLDMIDKQYKKGARTGLERGKNGFGKGWKRG